MSIGLVESTITPSTIPTLNIGKAWNLVVLTPLVTPPSHAIAMVKNTMTMAFRAKAIE